MFHVGALLDHPLPLVETLNEFRFAAHCIRDLDAAWHALREGSEQGVNLLLPVDPPEEWDRFALSIFLIEMMSALLRPISPQPGPRRSASTGDASSSKPAKTLEQKAL